MKRVNRRLPIVELQRYGFSKHSESVQIPGKLQFPRLTPVN